MRCVFFCLSTDKDPKKIKRERISVHGFYRIGKVIGDGNFAVVRECKNRYVFLLIENVNRNNNVQHFFNMPLKIIFSNIKTLSLQYFLGKLINNTVSCQ